MTDRKTAIFLSRTGPGIGFGHAARCLALAEALASERWQCTLALSAPAGPLLSISSAPGIEIVAADWATPTPDKVRQRWPDGVGLVVLDNDDLGQDFERALAGWAEHRLVIDDLLSRPHACETVLCVAPPARFHQEPRDGEPTLLSGPSYALLARKFWDLRIRQLVAGETRKPRNGIVVSVGGSSQVRLQEFILRGLSSLSLPLQVKLVGPDADAVIRNLKPEAAALEVEPLSAGADLAKLLSEAEIGVGACGGSAWERAALALPSVSFEIADNQRHVARILRQSRAAIVLPAGERLARSGFARAVRKLLADKDLAAEMGHRAESLVDALGARRVLLRVAPEQTEQGVPVSLRPARKDDCGLIYKWQKAPGTRAYANDPKPPDWPSHRRWFASQLENPRSLLSIITCGSEDVGALRVDLCEHRGRTAGIVSLYLAPAAKGRGVGTAALRALRRLVPDLPLDAEIDRRNVASLAAFAKAGYRQTDERWFCRDADAASP